MITSMNMGDLRPLGGPAGSGVSPGSSERTEVTPNPVDRSGFRSGEFLHDAGLHRTPDHTAPSLQGTIRTLPLGSFRNSSSGIMPHQVLCHAGI